MAYYLKTVKIVDAPAVTVTVFQGSGLARLDIEEGDRTSLDGVEIRKLRKALKRALIAVETNGG